MSGGENPAGPPVSYAVVQMIELTKLNGGKLVVNSDLIEFVEVLPDSLITLTTGKKIMVQEKIPEIIAAVIEFRRRIYAGRKHSEVLTRDKSEATAAKVDKKKEKKNTP